MELPHPPLQPPQKRHRCGDAPPAPTGQAEVVLPNIFTDDHIDDTAFDTMPIKTEQEPVKLEPEQADKKATQTCKAEGIKQEVKSEDQAKRIKQKVKSEVKAERIEQEVKVKNKAAVVKEEKQAEVAVTAEPVEVAVTAEPVSPVHAPPAERTCLHPTPPEGYGFWSDWNTQETLAEEAAMSTRLKIPVKLRGPLPPFEGGPLLWNDTPFDVNSHSWFFTSREQLPSAYREITDWHSTEGLTHEHELAIAYRSNESHSSVHVAIQSPVLRQ